MVEHPSAKPEGSMIDFRDGNSVIFFVSRSDNIFYQDFLKLPVEVRGKNEGEGRVISTLRFAQVSKYLLLVQ